MVTKVHTNIALYPLLLLFLITTIHCDDDRIVFPDDKSYFVPQNHQSTTQNQGENKEHSNGVTSTTSTTLPPIKHDLDIPATEIEKLPIDLIQKLNDVDNLEEFQSRFLDEDETLGESFIENRFDDSGARANAVEAKPAGCQPELQTVKLEPLQREVGSFIFPTCTRLERCGGCCNHHLLSCQPSEVEIVNFKVSVNQYTGSGRFGYRGRVIIPVEKHVRCKCDCKIKETDCNQFQVYRPNECRCSCRNEDEKRKCEKLNDTKLWDEDICVCRCRDPVECSTGAYYDLQECRCATDPFANRFGQASTDQIKQIQNQRKSLKLIPVPLESYERNRSN